MKKAQRFAKMFAASFVVEIYFNFQSELLPNET